MTDPILDQLHNTRRRLLADAGGTLEGLAARLQERQRVSGRRILEARRTVTSTHAKRLDGSPPEDQSTLPSGE